MIRLTPAAAPALLLLMLAGCSGAQLSHNLGLSRDSPDEFQVTTRAPLAMPSDDSLPVPQPGAPRPQEPSTELAAEASLVPQIELSARAGQDTPGQDALVAKAGPPAPANIRQTITAEQTKLNSNAGIGNTLAFWQKTPLPGRVINPVKEAARLHAIGIPTVGGADAAPTP